MKVAFVYSGAESLGIEYLSSSLKEAGHETGLAFDAALFADKRYLNVALLGKAFNPRRDYLISVIRSLKPDLVAFSVIKDLYAWSLEIAKEVKNSLGLPVVFGGIHPTSVPTEVIKNDYVDYVVIGEGEGPLTELASAIESGTALEKIKNLWFKTENGIVNNLTRPPIEDLDTVPFPDKELFSDFIPLNDSYSIMASRGCPLACSFCCSNILTDLYKGKGSFFRLRSIDNVIGELGTMKTKYGFREVDFCDDVFTLDLNWLRKFLPRYRKEISLPFRCLSHPKYFSKEMGLLLKDNGCQRVRLSAQTMNEDIRRNVLNRLETNEEIIKAFDICEEIKLPYTADHLFGLPGETSADHINAAEIYCNKRHLGRISCYYLEYFPGAKITNYARERGILDENDIAGINSARGRGYFESNTVLRKVPEQAQTDENFKRFFEIMPALPFFIKKLILKSRMYMLFGYLPRFLFFGAMIFVEVLKKDLGALAYFKYYCKNIFRKKTSAA